MRILNFTPKNVGPFDGKSHLVIEEEVTVITGGNDSGKSKLLDAIRLLYRGEKIQSEADAYYDRPSRVSSAWNADESIGCSADFFDSPKNDFIHGRPGGDRSQDRLVIEACFSPGKANRHLARRFQGTSEFNPKGNLAGFPSLIDLSFRESISDDFPLDAPNRVEAQLLSIGFGPGFKPQALTSMNDIGYTRELRGAGNKITVAFSRIAPQDLQLQVELVAVMGKRERIGVMITDTRGAHTSISSRGSGVRILLSTLVQLASSDHREVNTLVIADEPETSLHADAQHQLRAYLERLAQQPRFQVIYATHSPAMINPLRPGAIRLLERQAEGDRSFSKINNEAYRESFARVRTTLGVTPQDSLLFGLVTVIFEGPSEILSIADGIRKHASASTSDFADADHLLAMCCFVSGGGDSLDYMCRLATSNGSGVVLFTDGDKIRRIRQLQSAKKLDGVNVVSLSTNLEVEDLVDHEIYFKALAEECELGGDKCNPQIFHEWLKLTQPKSPLISKRISDWLFEIAPEAIYDKPRTMRRAISLATADKIQVEPLKQLLGAIRQEMERALSK